VTWQVAFGAVVALAMNSMAQPGGKFCGFPSRYRRYLSSSPILCLANAISTVLSVLLAMLCLKMDPRKACLFAVRARSEVISTEVKEKNDAIIGKVIHERFAKVIVRKIGPTVTQLEVIPKKGEPDIQKETFPRWVFFVMRALPAAIKIASFAGTSWTKLWGMSFVLSFLITEAVTVLSSQSSSIGSKHSVAVFPTLELNNVESKGLPRYHFLARERYLAHWIETFDTFFFPLSCCAHLSLDIWIIEGFWVPFMRKVYVPLVIHYTQSTMILGLISFLPIWLIRRKGYFVDWHTTNRSMAQLFKAMAVGFWLLFWSGARPHNARTATWGCALFYLGTIYVLVYRGLIWAGGRWPAIEGVLQWMALLEHDAENGLPEDESRIERGALFSFYFFLTNLVLCLLGYALIFNSNGTLQPSWNAVFG
jgi:hypothetical protein